MTNEFLGYDVYYMINDLYVALAKNGDLHSGGVY